MIWSMVRAPGGDLWFGASQALWRLSPHGDWHRFTRADGLPGDDVLALTASADGTVWAAVWEMEEGGYVGRGISGLHPDGTWTTLTTADGLPSNNVRTVEIDAEGGLWVGTGDEDRRSGEGAARRSPTGNWERYTITQGLPANYVEQICTTPDGSTWIVTLDLARRVIRLFPDGRRFVYTARDGLIDGWVNAMGVAEDGAVWFGTAKGASRLGPDDRWTHYTTADGLLHNTVVAVAPAPDGAVWFGTPTGLCRLDAEGEWSSYSTGAHHPDHHIHALCAAGDGSAWAATVSGLFHFKPTVRGAQRGGPTVWSDGNGQPARDNGDLEVGEFAVQTPRHRGADSAMALAAHFVQYWRSIGHRRMGGMAGAAAWRRR